MFQVRIHGRGGQGVVTAAEMLSIAAFLEGRHAQAFPTFGSERTGAPVVAFCRIDDKEIRVREPITEPDALIIQDPTLLHQVAVFSGLSKEGYVLINSTRDFAELGLDDLAASVGVAPRHPRQGADSHTVRRDRLMTVPATELALRHVGRPVPNAALLGGFCALSGLVSLESVHAAIRDKFTGDIAAGNIAAASEAYEYVRREMGQEMKETAHAEAN
ncbi:MAG TPA: 2-oxoacid:acceptor oxidoreductase family protein [Streptosporangiaceae bacterium]|jgi:pyruvate ferredoxin oxidoreductase gamma subunit